MNRHALRTWAGLCLAALTGLGLPMTGHAAITPQAIAVAGRQATGFDLGVTHAFRVAPTPSTATLALGHGGHALFSANVSGPGIVVDGNDAVLWQRDPAGGLSLVARMGADAPDLGAGYPLRSFFATGVAPTGASAFRAKLGPLGTGLVTDQNELVAYLRGADGHVTLLAQEGQPVPGKTWFPLGYEQPEGTNLLPFLNGAGQVRFWHTLRMYTDEWFAQFGPLPGEELGRVLENGTCVPGFDCTREYLWLSETAMNDLGDFAGHANWKTTGAAGYGYSAVVGPGLHGPLSLLASQSDVVPGYVAPAQWLEFLDSDDVCLTAAGNVFFTGEFYDQDL